MKPRFNRRAICSTDGSFQSYIGSKVSHIKMLERNHNHFDFTQFSDEVCSERRVIPKPFNRTIRVFGKEISVTAEEYNKYCKTYGKDY